MAEAVFASEQVKKLTFVNRATGLAVAHAPVASLAENFFVRDSPGDRRNWNREYQQRQYLLSEARVHISTSLMTLQRDHRFARVQIITLKRPDWAVSNYGNYCDFVAPALACSGTNSIC